MFCTSCGKKLSDNARFCPCCGSKVEETVTYRVTVQQQTAQIGLKRYGYNSGQFGFVIFQIFLCSILIITMILLLCFVGSWHLPSETRTGLTVSFWMLLVLNTVTLIIKIVNANTINKTCLYISDEGISGVGGTPTYFSNENVNIRYQDITMVTAKSGLVIVSTMMRDYKFLVENNDIAAGEILSHVERLKRKDNRK